MAKQDRLGERKPRNQKRTTDLGYYLIVTNTKETEKCYFEGLHKSLPKNLQPRLFISVHKAKTQSMIEKCNQLRAFDPQVRRPWIVFDRDEEPHFDDLIAEAERQNIPVGWSNPCFEIWLYAYFGNMPTMQNSTECCTRFAAEYKKKTGMVYSKADNQLYKRLCECGKEREAFVLAKKKLKQCEDEIKPSGKCPATTVYQLVEEIKKKVPYK